MTETKHYLPVMEEKFQVRSFTVDIHYKLKLNYLTAFLQEAAWKHAKHLDFGYDYMQQKNVAWMLSKLRVEMNVYPKWGDEITIQTWPKGVDGICYVRDFLIKNESGENIGAATSNYLLFDLNSKRPKVPEPHSEVLTANKDKHALSIRLSKIITDCQEKSGTIIAKFGDIDLNNHVNSNKYVEWITNVLPESLFSNTTIKTFQINFLQEVHIHEEIVICFSENKTNKQYILEGINQTTGKACFQGLIGWE